MQQQSITLIGAGIGGLMAALSLQQYGFKVRIFEQAPALGEVGAGLTLTPNATHALAHVGLLDDILKVSNQPGPGLVRHWQTGEELVQTRTSGSPQERYGAPICQLHRADLHTLLLNAVLARDPEAIVLDHRVASVSQDDTSARIQFSNGNSAECAVLIACDGVRSLVRDQHFSPEPVAFTGQIAFRGLVPVERVSEALITPRSAISIGPGRFFLRYLIKNGTLVNYVAVTRSDQWTEEGWSTPATREQVLALYEGWDSNVRDIIAATPANNLFKWALCSRSPLPSWINGRIALLGDACHPTSPFMGQGAAMAIEDGLVLARCFAAAGDYREAFQRYDSARRERTIKLTALAWEQGKKYQSEDPYSYTPAVHASAHNDWVFAYNPATTPV